MGSSMVRARPQVPALVGIGLYGEGPEEAVRAPARAGAAVIAVFFGGFLGWAMLAPLAGGTVASGILDSEGATRPVQHLEGGILHELHVRDGDRVAAGDPLLSLAAVGPATDVEALLDRRRTLLAEQARLEAEVAGAETIEFPAEAIESPEGRAAVAAERRLFEARTTTLEARRQALEHRIGQFREQIVGHQAQTEGATEQLELLQEEIDAKTHLVERNLAPRLDLLRLQRVAAELRAQRAEQLAASARIERQIRETEIDLAALGAERQERASARGAEVRAELASVAQALAASEDVLGRTVVFAPVSGIVNDLRFRTIGGVIRPGETVLDIVPVEETLIVRARVLPKDVNAVSVGLEARVRFPSLPLRAMTDLSGQVTTVSADRHVDANTRENYFEVVVLLDPDELMGLAEFHLTVGMPADVIIVKEERTLARYLMQPIQDVLWRGAREG